MRHESATSSKPHAGPAAAIGRFAAASLLYLILARLLQGAGLPAGLAYWLVGCALLGLYARAAHLRLRQAQRHIQQVRQEFQADRTLLASKLDAVSRLYYDAQRKAVTDGLTGLITHAHFKEQLASRFFEARRFDHALSLMFIDIDHFKKINDTYGHQTGDEVLRQVCRVIQDRVRACDVAARYGGEEIAVLLPQTDLAGAMILAERMREAIGALSVTDLRGQALVAVTASVGVSELGHDDQVPADLIERADQAVYQAKHRGRNQVVPQNPALLA